MKIKKIAIGELVDKNSIIPKKMLKSFMGGYDGSACQSGDLCVCSCGYLAYEFCRFDIICAAGPGCECRIY
jgi:hypothetical protein